MDNMKAAIIVWSDLDNPNRGRLLMVCGVLRKLSFRPPPIEGFEAHPISAG